MDYLETIPPTVGIWGLERYLGVGRTGVGDDKSFPSLQPHSVELKQFFRDLSLSVILLQTTPHHHFSDFKDSQESGRL